MTYVRKLTALAIAGAFSTLASTAFADALPPDDCDSKMVGDTCHTDDGEGDAGVCATSTCAGGANHECVLAAEDSGADAASCVSTVPCVVCVAGNVPVTDSGITTTTDGGTTTTTTSDGGTTTTTTSDDSSGCSVGATSVRDTLKSAAPFALALLVPLALRRKKKKPAKDDAAA